MQGLADEEPSLFAVHPHPFVVGLLQGHARRLTGGHRLLQPRQNGIGIGRKIRGVHRQTELLRLRRLFQICNQILDVPALFLQPRSFRYDLRRQVGAVVQEVILLEGCVA